MATCPRCKKLVSEDEEKCRYCGNYIRADPYSAGETDSISAQETGGIRWFRLIVSGLAAFVFADVCFNPDAGKVLFFPEALVSFAMFWLLFGTKGTSWQGIVKVFFAVVLAALLLGLKACDLLSTYGRGW